MPQDEQDVKDQATSSSADGAVEEPQIDSEANPEQTEDQSQDSLPVGETDVDDMGVPYKNRYMEAQRKLDKMAGQYDEILSRLDSTQPSSGQREPSLEELEAFAEQSENPIHRQWAKGEIRKREKESNAKVIRSEMDKWKQEQKNEQIKAQTFQTVTSRNPDIAIRDRSGNFVAWNEKSPMFQRMNFYMSNPRIANQPDALEIAEAFAIRDLTHSSAPTVTKKIKKQEGEIKNLQKKTLTEGGGAQETVVKSSYLIAKEKAAKTGSVKDAAAVYKEMLRAKGRLSE